MNQQQPQQGAPQQATAPARSNGRVESSSVATELLNDATPYSEDENGMIAKGEASITAFLANTYKKKVS
jgi:hypothetical protein